MERLVFKVDEIPPEGLGFRLAADPARYGIDQVAVRNPPGISGEVDFRRERAEIAVSGRIAAVLEVPCGRCLAPVGHPLEAEFAFRLVPERKEPDEEELELTRGELEIEFFKGDEIDLRAIVAEQIYLNAPLRALCSEECKGLCPRCGQDLNARDCGHRGEVQDTRWEALKDLKTPTQEE